MFQWYSLLGSLVPSSLRYLVSAAVSDIPELALAVSSFIEYVILFNLILENYNKNGTIIISTHLISEAEKILTEFMFIKNGEIIRKGNVKSVVENQHKSIDEIFREDFKCLKDF